MKRKDRKVVVAMSGGVDSSVAAALLKRAGPEGVASRPYGVNFNVVGAFMRFWQAPGDKPQQRWNRCCSAEAQERAKRVAQELGIPFYVFNFEKEFKKEIVDYFLEEYKKGRTPNPCVICNKEIKFGLLIKKALALKADFVATGHYAKLCCSDGMFRLLKAKDKDKDQSYFLWQLGQTELKRVLFPVGNYTKKEVRALAQKFKLPVAGTKESQEICFIKDTTEEFLRCYLKEKPGRIIDADSRTMGEHKGLWFYTIGQRKGIGLSGGPYYVLEKNLKTNTLVVTKNPKDLVKKDLLAKNVNWISGKLLRLPLKVQAKIRYNSPLVSAVVKKASRVGYLRVVFSKPQSAITPGQSVVFYNGQELLGGGVIL